MLVSRETHHFLYHFIHPFISLSQKKLQPALTWQITIDIIFSFTSIHCFMIPVWSMGPQYLHSHLTIFFTRIKKQTTTSSFQCFHYKNNYVISCGLSLKIGTNHFLHTWCTYVHAFLQFTHTPDHMFTGTWVCQCFL